MDVTSCDMTRGMISAEVASSLIAGTLWVLSHENEKEITDTLIDNFITAIRKDVPSRLKLMNDFAKQQIGDNIG
jgi:hypothetical protein